MSVYKRGARTFARQLKSVEAQSPRVAEIVVWQQARHYDVRRSLRKRPNITHVLAEGSTPNVFARFSLALTASSPIVCVFDDDVIPQSGFLAEVVRELTGSNATAFDVVGCSGRTVRIRGDDHTVERMAGVPGRRADWTDLHRAMSVDFPIQCYCGYRELFKAFWAAPDYRGGESLTPGQGAGFRSAVRSLVRSKSPGTTEDNAATPDEAPFRYDNGEDIRLGAVSALHGGRVVVPRQVRAEGTLGNSEAGWGADEHAVSAQADHTELRRCIAEWWIHRVGWRPQALQRRTAPGMSPQPSYP